MEENPIARFNLNIDGTNPDIELVTMNACALTLQEQFEKTHQKPNDTLLAELDDPKILVDAVSGQQFSVLYLNRFAKGRPIIKALSWSVNHSTHSGAREEAMQTAIQTSRPLWVINNLSIGSSKLTRDQRKSLESSEGFSAIARPLLAALKDRCIDEIDIDGTSMGGRLAAALAALASNYGIRVCNVVIIDPPGFENKTLRTITLDFVGEDARLTKYVEFSHEPVVLAKKEKPVGSVRFFFRLARVDIRGVFKSYTKAMAKETLPLDILAALKTQPGMYITMIIGTGSNISSPKKVMKFHCLLPGELKPRFRLKLLPGDTHALGGGSSKRIAWHIKQALQA